jgi:hypothetical protein
MLCATDIGYAQPEYCSYKFVANDMPMRSRITHANTCAFRRENFDGVGNNTRSTGQAVSR